MAQTRSAGSPFAHGITVFAGVMLIIAGGFQAIQAVAAIVHDQYILVLPNYIYGFDLTAWGWIHLLVGLGLAVIGIFVLRGQTWARVAGMVLAGISGSSTSSGCPKHLGGHCCSSPLTFLSFGLSRPGDR